jgi:hypothetical protein
MAALRYSSPDRPTILVDIGPSYGRAYPARYQVDLVTGTGPSMQQRSASRAKERERSAQKRWYEANKALVMERQREYRKRKRGAA